MMRSAFLLLFLLLVACGEATAPTVGEEEAAGASGTAGTGGASVLVADCEPGEGEVCVQNVRGQVQDEEGKPLKQQVVSVCGAGCYVGKTSEDGLFSVRIEAPLRVDAYALLVHGGVDYSSIYLRLPSLDTNVFFSSAIRLPRLPVEGPILPADGGAQEKITSGRLSLELAQGTSFELDVDDIVRGEEGRRWRVTEVNPSQAAFVEGARLVFAMAPFGAKLSKPARISVSSDAGLPEGQVVSFVMMDDDLLAEVGNLAGLPKVVAQGQVQDGVIVSDVGQGLDKITWLAVVPK